MEIEFYCFEFILARTQKDYEEFNSRDSIVVDERPQQKQNQIPITPFSLNRSVMTRLPQYSHFIRFPSSKSLYRHLSLSVSYETRFDGNSLLPCL